MKRFAVVVLAGCAASPSVPKVRYANQPVVTVVNDRRNVAKQPEEIVYDRYLKNFDGTFFRLVTRKLELRRPQRAQGINALDEVPDSTWFTNRIGVRHVSPEELAILPGGVGSPEHHKPWTIKSTKVGGLTIGFIIEDTRGEKFILKFDQKQIPETETSTQIIGGRLLWAFGYNVTDDYVVQLRKEDLVLAPDAKIKDPQGGESPLDERELQARLAKVYIKPDGTLRGLASRYLDGKPLGGHPVEGVRKDDPNDLIPHELRRDLRGARAVFAWLDHSDLHYANSLDMWVEDPADPKHHYVKHYFIDYGIALGIAATKNEAMRYGYEYVLDWRAMARSLVTFGLLHRPWEHRRNPPYKGLGRYEIDNYNPGEWKPLTQMYTPVRVSDRIDNFWSSKIMMRLSREHIQAAVDAAQLSDPRATTWLVDALVARQRKTARYWFERVNPVDEIRADARSLCFKDLSIVYSFARAAGTTYQITFYDVRGKRVGTAKLGATQTGATCARLQVADTHDGYTIVRVTTKRPGFSRSTFVHVARDERTQVPRVIGIWRE